MDGSSRPGNGSLILISFLCDFDVIGLMSLCAFQITRVADGVGAGVHFNPFVEWRDKVLPLPPTSAIHLSFATNVLYSLLFYIFCVIRICRACR